MKRSRHDSLTTAAWVASILVAFAAGWALARRPALQPSAFSYAAVPVGVQNDPAAASRSGFAEALLFEDSLERTAAIALALRAMPPAAIEENLDALLPATPTPLGDEAIRQLWMRFGELQGRAAIAKAEAIPAPARRQEALTAAAAGWAHSDPEAAWEWAMDPEAAQIPQGAALQRQKQRLVHVAGALLEAGDIDTLAARLAALPDSPLRNAVALEVAEKLSRYEPEALLAMIDHLPPGSARIALLSGFAREWAGRNPPEAAAWARTLNNTESGPVLTAVGQVWFDSGRLGELTDWLLHEPAGNDLDALLRGVTPSLAQRDPAAAHPLLQRIHDPAMRDAAISSLARSTFPDAPSHAAAWAERIDNPEARRRQLSEIVHSWSETDFGAARNYVLYSPGLTGEDRRFLQALLQRPPAPAADARNDAEAGFP